MRPALLTVEKVTEEARNRLLLRVLDPPSSHAHRQCLNASPLCTLFEGLMLTPAVVSVAAGASSRSGGVVAAHAAREGTTGKAPVHLSNTSTGKAKR